MAAGNPYTIQLAVPADLDTLIAFTLAEAREAEGIALETVAVRRGVRAAFADPPRARYWLAVAPDGHAVASTSVVTEWSNFHGGEYWWVQSLYIVPEHRGRGLADRLLDHLWSAARAAGALDLRLYAHQSNEKALRVYKRCGFTASPYMILTRATREGQEP